MPRRDVCFLHVHNIAFASVAVLERRLAEKTQEFDDVAAQLRKAREKEERDREREKILGGGARDREREKEKEDATRKASKAQVQGETIPWRCSDACM